MENIRQIVTCPCGLSRSLPADIKVGDDFQLVACARCGSPMRGTFLGDRVKEKL